MYTNLQRCNDEKSSARSHHHDHNSVGICLFRLIQQAGMNRSFIGIILGDPSQRFRLSEDPSPLVKA